MSSAYTPEAESGRAEHRVARAEPVDVLPDRFHVPRQLLTQHLGPRPRRAHEGPHEEAEPQ